MENIGVFLAIALMPIVVTALIIGYKLKSRELETRGFPSLQKPHDVL